MHNREYVRLAMVAGQLSVAIAVGALGRQAAAQTVQDEDVARRMQARVDLRLGQTTLGEVAASLSQQTGLAIDAAEYLKEHRLIVAIGSATAAGALNSLCELNGWHWRQDAATHVLIERPRAARPRSVGDIAAALRAALPSDYARFIAHDPSADAGPDAKVDLYKRAGLQYRVAAPLQQKRAAAACETLAAPLRARIQKLRDGDGRLPVASLQPGERRDLVDLLVLDLISQMCDENLAGVLLGTPAQYITDPDSALVKLDLHNPSRPGISIDSVRDEPGGLHIEEGFGAPVGPPVVSQP